MRGMTAGMVFVSDVLEQHSAALARRKILGKNDIKFVLAVIEACLRRRETLAQVGPKKMNLFVRTDGRVDLKEK